MKKINKTIGISLGLIVVCIIIFSFEINIITVHEETNSSMGETFTRIRFFLKETGRLPANLRELPLREGFVNSIVDGWGRELIYTIESDGSVSLKSYGQDGKIGGTGDNADIVRSVSPG